MNYLVCNVIKNFWMVRASKKVENHWDRHFTEHPLFGGLGKQFYFIHISIKQKKIK